MHLDKKAKKASKLVIIIFRNQFILIVKIKKIFILRAPIYKKGAVPKIDYFKYDFFPTFFLFFKSSTQIRLRKKILDQTELN